MFDDRYRRRDDGKGPQWPRSEPEIIPPGRESRHEREQRQQGWVYDDRTGVHRIFVAQPGPFSLLAALLIVGLVVAAIVVLVLGLFLFWIPVVVLVVGGLLLSGYIRYAWRRLQHWMHSR